jgi:hypothetical protein
MPTEAKLGLVLGIGLTILLAIYFRPKETVAVETPSSVLTKVNTVAPGQSTSIRK